jgi:osmotically-inducible protein OsmY
MNQYNPSRLRSATLTALVAITVANTVWLGGCAAVAAAGAVGAVMVASDRRTSGTQLEDQSIELKAVTRISETVGDRGHLNVVSYNRMVLLTGEVASEADRMAVEQAISRIENVRSTVNELAVMASTSFTERSNDSVLTSRVKGSFVDAKDLHANAFKVVTERAVVYLMGRVTEREATRAAELARSVSGVQKVVRVFDILTEAELTALGSDGKKN